jgi:hypothetical protein
MTRRQVLVRFSLPFLPALASSRGAAQNSVRIVSEPHLLSTESTAGFKICLPKILRLGRPVILLPGAKQVSIQEALALRSQVKKGSLLIWESGLAFGGSSEINQQRRMLAQIFGVRLHDPIGKSFDGPPYVAFAGTPECLIRPFGSVMSIQCEQSETAAHWGGIPVAVRKALGEGELVYLGAMIGPSLLASDSEAQRYLNCLLRS